MSEKKPAYWELLRDPRWQKKRLEIMQRDEFACRRCYDESTTLNVHHSYYERGLSPWEYPDFSLWTLCEPCHEIVQEQMKLLHRAIGLIDLNSIQQLIGVVKLMAVQDPDEPMRADSEAEAEGMMLLMGGFIGMSSRKLRSEQVFSSDGTACWRDIHGAFDIPERPAT
jgi:hypothetical protein